MSNKGNPKLSVGKGAQSEHHNEPDEKSYVKDNTESDNTENEKDGNDYLEQKWKKIASDFNKNYNLNTNVSEFKDESFSETLKKLENKTGKSRVQLEKEIKNWK